MTTTATQLYATKNDPPEATRSEAVQLLSGAEHVEALSSALATFGRTARMGIEEMNELSDADSADILTEISRGVDQWLWFVEAHRQGRPEER